MRKSPSRSSRVANKPSSRLKGSVRCPTLRGEGSTPYTQMLPRGQALGTIQLSSGQKHRMKASSATPRETQPTTSPWKVHGETWASKVKEQSNKEGTGPREERVRPRGAAENGHLSWRVRFGGFMTSPQALSNAGVGTRKKAGRQAGAVSISCSCRCSG